MKFNSSVQTCVIIKKVEHSNEIFFSQYSEHH